MSFWEIFKKTAEFRMSWHIQDIFLGAFRSAQSAYRSEEKRQSLLNNNDEILNKVNNNSFSKKRVKK
jgi:cation transport regulator ChaB